MIRLFRFTCVLMGICTLAILIPSLIARGFPSPLTALFTDANGLPCTHPCLLGVRLGQTKIKDGLEVLKVHPLTRDFEVQSRSPFIMGSRQDKSTLLRFATTRDGVLDSIELSGDSLPYPVQALDLLPMRVTVGDLIAKFGAPDSINMYGSQIYLNFLQDNYILSAMVPLTAPPDQLHGLHVGFSWPLSAIMLTHRIKCAPDYFSNNFARWTGFTTLDRIKMETNIKVLLQYFEAPDYNSGLPEPTFCDL